MSKYYSSILEIICGNFCRNFCNFSFDGRLSLRNKKKYTSLSMGAGILKLLLEECYLLTLAARFGCTPASAFKYLDRKHTMLNNSASYKTSVAGKRKRAQSRIALEKQIQPGACVDDFGTGVYLSSGKGVLLAMSDNVAEK